MTAFGIFMCIAITVVITAPVYLILEIGRKPPPDEMI